MLLFRRLIEAVIIIGDVIWGLPSSSEDGVRRFIVTQTTKVIWNQMMSIQGQIIAHLWLRTRHLLFGMLFLFVLLSLFDLLEEFLGLFEEF